MSNVKFLPEWTREQFEQMDGAIVAHFTKRSHWKIMGKVQRVPKTFEKIDEVLGLAYTSSSSYAMYSICNVNLDYNGIYHYVCFGIGVDGKCYGVCHDKHENELIIKLENQPV